jgi:release factor glutamine methyltransferase
MSIPPTPQEIELLRRDKYDGDAHADITADVERLAAGEPLAYVIGWIPFLSLKIGLESRPLIPRPETEWWTEKLIEHLKYRFAVHEVSGSQAEPPTTFRLLDLCAGSGAIGLAVLSQLPNAYVSCGEIDSNHVEQITKNLTINGLGAHRVDIHASDLFDAFKGQRFDVIVSNPPYIPESRELDTSVMNYEPSEALLAGKEGLDIIRRIIKEAPKYLNPGGELWMECDIENVAAAEDLVRAAGADESAIHLDLYGRPRLIVGHFT